MLWMLVVILLILWLMGWTVFHVAGGLIHLLLVVALIVIVYRLVTGRRVWWLVTAALPISASSRSSIPGSGKSGSRRSCWTMKFTAIPAGRRAV